MNINEKKTGFKSINPQYLKYSQDDLNEQLRVAEASEKEAADLEEETKLKHEEADRQKQDVDEKLVQCLARETRVIDDLQKLKVRKDSSLDYFG